MWLRMLRRCAIFWVVKERECDLHLFLDLRFGCAYIKAREFAGWPPVDPLLVADALALVCDRELKALHQIDGAFVLALFAQKCRGADMVPVHETGPHVSQN